MSRSRWLKWFRPIHNSRFILAAVASTFIQPQYSSAYELNRAEVTEDNGVFHIFVSATVEAPADYIRQVLTDYTHIYRLSSSIIESEVLHPDRGGDTRIRTKLLACASVFCREVERVDNVRTLASGDLRARIVPELSEFRSGQATWKITSMDNRSNLVYQATLEPDFFIPPVVGVPAIRSSLKAEFIATFGRIERIASINAERHRREEHSLAAVDVEKARLPCNKRPSTGMQ